MSKANETIQHRALQLHKATGMPLDRAEAKAESTYVGKIAVRLGIAALVFAGGVVTFMLLTRQISWLTVLLALVFAGVGVGCIGLGFSLISREAAPIVASIGNLLKRVLLKLPFLKGNGTNGA